MKRFFLSVFLASFSLLAWTQQHYFVYFQTDNHQPFYVKLNNNILSSSVSGYLIIPKLQNGDYTLTLGFPKKEKAEQVFSFKISEKDLGFLIKDFGEKGWGLFNFQTMEVLMASQSPASQKVLKDTSTDAFTNILANVVNTPSIKEKTVRAPDIKEPMQEVKANTDTITKVEKDDENAIVIKKNLDSANSIKPVNTGIKRLKTISETDGRTIIYLVTELGLLDTVRVFLPVIQNEEKAKSTSKQGDKNIEGAPQNNTDKPSEKFLAIELPNPNAGNSTIDTTPKNSKTIISEDGTLQYNSDCKTLATQDNFIDLRRKMVARENEKDMIKEALKSLKQMCYSTEQIKGLSSLFLNDKNKLDFFKTAYPFVYDTNHFPSLQSQLTEEANINSFKALLIK